MAQRPLTVIDLTGMLHLGAITKSVTLVAIPGDLAQTIIDKLKLLDIIETKLRSTPAGTLLLEAEIAGLHSITE